jgi:hypothetical protein
MGPRFLLTSTLLAILTACAPAIATPSPSPTLTPLPPAAIQPTTLPTETATSSPTFEIIFPTLESTLTPEPTISATLPTLSTLNLPATPTATSIPTPAIGSGVIQFYAPGPLSKLVSPLAVYGYAMPGYDNQGELSLYGEDGRLLYSDILQLYTPYTLALFSVTLPFQIQAAGELARLTLSTQDQYGRTTAVNSVHLILLSDGLSIVNPSGDLRERCIIEQPAPGRRYGGGTLLVYGEMRPFNNVPLVIELVTREGNVIASQAVPIAPAADDGYVPFYANLPYSIHSGSWALLAVHQLDERIGGTMYLYSREVFLNP